jgi:hypothetical protein
MKKNVLSGWEGTPIVAKSLNYLGRNGDSFTSASEGSSCNTGWALDLWDAVAHIVHAH